MVLPRVATIAGSDTTGGAGMLADLKIFEDYDVFGMVALTCIVSLNKEKNWEPSIHPINLALLKEQVETVLHAQPHVIKTGMIPTVEQMTYVAEQLRHTKAKIIVDPVMACKHGEETVLEPLKEAFITQLLPLATIVTPNLFEASLLTQQTIHSIDEMEQAAKYIVHTLHANSVVIKGGTRLNHTQAVDIFYDGHEMIHLTHPVIHHSYNHGAGCTFAAAIAAGVAQGLTLKEAVIKAKEVVTEAIKNSFKLNDEMSHIHHHAYFK